MNVVIALGYESWNRIHLEVPEAFTPNTKSKPSCSRIEKVLKTFSLNHYFLILILLFALPLAYNSYVKRSLPASFHGSTRVSIIQPNLSSSDYEGAILTESAIEKLAQLTDELIRDESTDLIVWPETAVPVPFLRSESVQQFLFSKVLEWETPLLTGTFDFVTYENDKDIPALARYLGRDYDMFNAAVLITPQLAWRHLMENLDVRSLTMYRKQNLMHFTERVPFSETFPSLSRFSIFGMDAIYNSGTDAAIMRYSARDDQIIGVSPIICWDLLYATSIPEIVHTGSSFIAAITNESQVGNQITTMVHEMEGFTRLRSIESRRSIAKASLTGYSFFTDPFGNIYGKVPWWSEQTSTNQVVLSSASSLFSRYPGSFPRLCLFLFLCISVYLFMTHQKYRRA